MAPIKILYPFVGGDTFGGSHVSALQMIRALDRDRFDPHILLHHDAGAVGDLIRDFGLDFELLRDVPIMAPRYSRKPGDATPLTFLTRSWRGLSRALRRIDPDIVHTNDGRMHSNWIGPTKAQRRKFIWHHRQAPEAAGVNFVAPLLADRILGVSEFSRPSRPVRSVAELYTVVRSPFLFPVIRPDRAAEHKALTQELGVPDDAILLGYFGELNVRKRPLDFVKAVKSVAAVFPERSVLGLFFGRPDGTEAAWDRQVAALSESLGLDDRIHLMGYRSPIEPAMAGVDVMLVPAVSEPFGRTLIEAMYLGTPVVATDHGGNPEAITDGVNGFLVPPDAPDTFAEPVRRLMSKPDLHARITGSAMRSAESGYGLTDHVRSVSRVYEAVTKPVPPHGESASSCQI
ncbi:glycosyltransferase family 4 protein [Oceanomicrobium pacificus]|uniref:Glycosyltransferase n=1 Tax=Oceanomicrobium pacificus TaxID=2692916 RepID=A0A6B0TW42_9RHOB|nr:glycosyltransferase family 4 protein [Oceanomicrobium pacificus]MXU65213.1 glycosyltransferase [Oceanomicrobium pacificus]